MIITRRSAILSTVFGTGYVGLRALATGLPVGLLLNPRKALADPALTCASQSKAQYVIFNTSVNGDPINPNVPGCYLDPNIVHPTDPTMAPTPLSIGGQMYTAAAPWAALPQSVLNQTQFWHIMTDTPVHPKEPDVLELMGATQAGEMFPSVLAKALAPCLNTIQPQPVSVGGPNPAETIYYEGAPLAILQPTALSATLTNPTGPLSNLQPLRDQTMNQLYDLYKNGASPAQQQYIDSLVTSQSQVRNIKQSLLSQLSAIKDDTQTSQITAAIALIQMNVAPVIGVHISFGGDNHHDVTNGEDLYDETTQSVAGVQAIGAMMSQLQSAGLQNKVTFMTLNVFGRTIGPGNTAGRQHNPNHQVSIAIGSQLKPGVYGAVTPVAPDYGATAINSQTGAGNSSGDIQPIDTLVAYAMTMLASLGASPSVITSPNGSGKVVSAALA
jgi:hypothetical protein